MNRLMRMACVAILLGTQGCATSSLWKRTNANERIWIDASKTTEEALKERGVEYQVYEGKNVKGYLIKKTSQDKMKDYSLRMLGTPVTLTVDAASAVVVVGVYIFFHDPIRTILSLRDLR